MQSQLTYKQTSVLFPLETLEALRRYVPRRKRSRVIVEATKERLEHIKQQHALSTSAGCWDDNDHPDIVAAGSSTAWVKKVRKEDTKRWMKKLEEQSS